MVDHKYKCIFIHQRKVAGNTIIRAFDKTVHMKEWHQYNSGALSPQWNLRPHPDYSYFVFSAVRNPFDRLISGWKYLPSLRNRPLEDVLEGLPHSGHDYRHIAEPQVAMLKDKVSGALVVQGLIRYEFLQADFNRICDRIGKPRRQLEWLNRSERDRDYRVYYTPKTRSLVEAIFADDLDTFGYNF